MKSKYVLIAVNAVNGEVKTGTILADTTADAIVYVLEKGLLNTDIQVGSIIPYDEWKKLITVTDDCMDQLVTSPEAVALVN